MLLSIYNQKEWLFEVSESGFCFLLYLFISNNCGGEFHLTEQTVAGRSEMGVSWMGKYLDFAVRCDYINLKVNRERERKLVFIGRQYPQ